MVPGPGCPGWPGGQLSATNSCQAKISNLRWITAKFPVVDRFGLGGASAGSAELSAVGLGGIWVSPDKLINRTTANKPAFLTFIKLAPCRPMQSKLVPVVMRYQLKKRPKGGSPLVARWK